MSKQIEINKLVVNYLSKIGYKSMAHAVNSAGRLGWEFVNANVQVIQGAPVHYYYMRKKK